MMDGSHNIPNLATVSQLIWTIALAKKEKICRAFNTNHSTILYVNVDHGSFYIAITKQLLDRPDIAASLQ